MIPLFFDKTGNAETFLKYTAVIADVAKLQIGIQIGGSTIQDAKEDMRIKFKGAMATGTSLVFYMDKIVGKFKQGMYSIVQTC